MSRQNDLTLQDIEKVKRGNKAIVKSLGKLGDKLTQSKCNRSRRDNSDDYVREDNYHNIGRPMTIDISVKVVNSSSRRYDIEDDEYMKAQKRLNWAGGFYMPR